MHDEMGTFQTWRFRQADGTVLERWIGAAFVHVAGKSTVDDVVFVEAGDLVLLGSRTLEGLNFRSSHIPGIERACNLFSQRAIVRRETA